MAEPNLNPRHPVLKPIALTAGEPAGIGPDLCVLLAQQALPARIVVIADTRLLEDRARQLGLPLRLVEFSPGAPVPLGPHTLEIRHHDLAAGAMPGRLDPRNGRYVLDTLADAVQGCLSGTFDAMVTAPVHKGVINDAGIPFTGHTEYLAGLTGTPHVVMMLAGGGMRVALATTHLPLKEVPAAITPEGLTRTLRILHQDLSRRFAIPAPHILVAGLNPHAGESGHLGREEIEVIAPVLEALRGEGMGLEGPLPADTLFTRENLERADCVLAMYHDQGLPVLKYASFGKGVNITLGLPIIRTSVDHGTALALAGTGKIETGSLAAAIAMALEMARNQAA
jgi:4-hydroxythreonine-4-phosphate dehydrogenase